MKLLTQNELRKIFDDTEKEFIRNINLPALVEEFNKKHATSPKETGALIGEVLAIMFKINQEYLFQVLSKVLAKNP